MKAHFKTFSQTFIQNLLQTSSLETRRRKKICRNFFDEKFFFAKLTFFAKVLGRLPPAAVDGRRQSLEMLGAALKEAVEVLASGWIVNIVVVGVGRRRGQRLRGRRETSGPERKFRNCIIRKKMAARKNELRSFLFDHVGVSQHVLRVIVLTQSSAVDHCKALLDLPDPIGCIL